MKTQPYWVRMGPHPRTGILERREMGLHRHTQRKDGPVKPEREAWDDGGRDWKPRRHQSLMATPGSWTEARGDSVPQVSERAWPCQQLDLGLPETRHFCCRSPPVCRTLLRPPREANTGKEDEKTRNSRPDRHVAVEPGERLACEGSLAGGRGPGTSKKRVSDAPFDRAGCDSPVPHKYPRLSPGETGHASPVGYLGQREGNSHCRDVSRDRKSEQGGALRIPGKLQEGRCAFSLHQGGKTWGPSQVTTA